MIGAYAFAPGISPRAPSSHFGTTVETIITSTWISASCDSRQLPADARLLEVAFAGVLCESNASSCTARLQNLQASREQVCPICFSGDHETFLLQQGQALAPLQAECVLAYLLHSSTHNRHSSINLNPSASAARDISHQAQASSGLEPKVRL
jgi:hypothetical protein